MRTVTKEELNEILENHKKWLNNEEGGEQANLSHADLRKVDLCGVDLSHANLCSSNLNGASLQNTNLKNANLKNVHLQCAKLERAYLTCANLQGADLISADLQHAKLRNADLLEADLRQVDLYHADLSSADLSSAQLQGANLSDADLQKSKLCGALLHAANLKGAHRPWMITASNVGRSSDTIIYFADYDHVICGHWNRYKGGRLAEFTKYIKHIDKYHADDKENLMYRIEYLSAIKMFSSMREAYLKSVEEEKNND